MLKLNGTATAKAKLISSWPTQYYSENDDGDVL